jgi:tight adherence protein C
MSDGWLVPVVSGLCALLCAAWFVRILARQRRLAQAARDESVPIGEVEPPVAPHAHPTGALNGAAAARTASDPWSLGAGLEPAARGAGNPVPRLGSDEFPARDTGDRWFGPPTPVLAALLPQSEAKRTETLRDLRRAGCYGPHAGENLAALRYLGIMLSLAACGAALLLVPARFELPVLALLVLLPSLCWAVPWVWVRNRATERTSRIETALPDMIDMVNMCVSQGLTVPESLRITARELHGPYPDLAQELAIVHEQARFGSLRQALENLRERIDVADVQGFASLLIQAEQMGTSVSAALAAASDDLREGLRQRADAKANQSTFKLLFPTVFCLLPAVYLFLLGPAVLEMSNFAEKGGLDGYRTDVQAVQRVQRMDADRSPNRP